jgi:hypothetical protein
MRYPPRLATWILQRLGTIDEALVGDLNEAYGDGRSRAWYWRQAGLAILLSVWRELRGHTPSALGAVVASLIVVSLSTSAGALLTQILGRWTWTGGADSWRDVFGGFVYRLPLIVTMGLGGACGGWLMVRLHGAERRAMVFVFSLFPLLSTILWTLRTIAAVTQGARPFFTALCATLTFLAMIVGTFVSGFWHHMRDRESAVTKVRLKPPSEGLR